MRQAVYIKSILIILVLFLGFHSIVWFGVTKQILSSGEPAEHVGDLARLSYVKEIAAPRIREVTLKNQHFDLSRGQFQVDMITVGDSFSRGVGGGENAYYQDFIVENLGLSVLNVRPDNSLGFIESVLVLLQLDEFKGNKPRYVLLQTIERHAVARLSKSINWDVEASEYLRIRLFKVPGGNGMPSVKFINGSNYNAVLYNLFYRFDTNAFFSKVHIVDIEKELFTSQAPKRLPFYYEDLESIESSTKKSVEHLNSNLNRLAQRLKEMGVTLIFMPNVDKYNLYSKYMTNNSFPHSNFFEYLRPLDKNYRFIDTKEILRSSLDDGVKDVYYSDDTHWSNIGSEIVVSKIFNDEYQLNQ